MSDLKNWDIYKDPLWLLHNLYGKYKVVHVPTNAGWATTIAGSGTVTYSPNRLTNETWATPNSVALANAICFGLTRDLQRNWVDWTKQLELSFILARDTSDVQCIARIQLKESSAEGILAQRGIGVEINNYDVFGEAYGTARSTVNLGVTLTNNYTKKVRIVKFTDRVEFWVDGILKGTLIGTAIPNIGTGSTWLVASIINGAAGVDDVLFTGNIQIVQEW